MPNFLGKDNCFCIFFPVALSIGSCCPPMYCTAVAVIICTVTTVHMPRANILIFFYVGARTELTHTAIWSNSSDFPRVSMFVGIQTAHNELALHSLRGLERQWCGHKKVGADDDRKLELPLDGEYFGLSISAKGD